LDTWHWTRCVDRLASFVLVTEDVPEMSGGEAAELLSPHWYDPKMEENYGLCDQIYSIAH
jgi:hypothetical protein